MNTQLLLTKGKQWWNKPYMPYLLMAGITLFALLLRFYKLGQWSFWIDEIRTVDRAQIQYSSLELILQNIPPVRNWIPLSTILIAKSINFFGLSEWSARFVPAIIGTISIPLLFFPIRRLLGFTTALIAALLLAMSPWHIAWSQNARFLSALMLFYLLASLAFFFALERARLKFIFLFIILIYLGASERLYVMFLVPVIVSYLVILKFYSIEKPTGFRFKNLSFLIIPGVLFVVIEVYSLIVDKTSRFFADFDVFIGSSIENPLGQAVFIFSEIGIPLVAFSFFTGIYLLLQKNRFGIFLWLSAVIPTALVILVTPFAFTEERYAFVTLPFWLILAAIGIREIFIKTDNYAKLLAVGVLLIFLADSAGEGLMYFRVNNGDRRDWKGAFALVEERSREGDIVVSTWPELGNYYLGQETVSWRDTNQDDVIQRDTRVWFVVIPDMAWYWGNEDFYWWVSTNSELIKVQYLRRRDDKNLFIYLYDPVRAEVTR